LNDQALSFGPFQLLGRERALLKEGKPLRLGARALDILLVLSERPGHIFTKNELIARVWPDTHVDEISLRVHIAALRKILGDGPRYITNVPGRGYCFTATLAGAAKEPLVDDQPAPGHSRLPAPARMIGRDEAARKVEARLAEHRFVTIVGPGGIGKTTLGLVVGNRRAADYADGAVFIDFAPLADPSLVTSKLASALGVSARAEDPMAGILAFLRDRQLLLLLDNCEHVIEPAARLAETLFREVPAVHILATSQEPLRAEGEWVHRLVPLSAPPPRTALSAAEALAFPCIQLFAERITASTDAFELRDADVTTLCELCRKLDGNPLAIELAAARVEQFGLPGLQARLEDRFAVLTRGRRTAVPRHQTLRATLDWSYGLLPETERIVLRRLAVLRNAFTPEAAAEIASDASISATDVHEAMSNLTAKSLIAIDFSAVYARDRLLESTRAYALEKLQESGESAEIAARHADYFRTLLTQAEAEWHSSAAPNWLADYGRTIDDVRAALDWSLSSEGRLETGLALAVASAPLWFQLSLAEEYFAWLERILETAGASAHMDAEQEMRLNIVYAQALWHTRGPVPAMEAAFRRTLEIAERLGRPDQQLQALWGIWTARNATVDYPVLAAVAEQIGQIAAQVEDEPLRLICSRNLAFAHHFLGNHALAASHAEATLSYCRRAAHPVRTLGFQVDHELAMQTLMAASLWIRGYADQAGQLAADCVEAVLSARHALSLCYALSLGAGPVAIWSGDLETARRYTALLDEHAGRHSLVHWQNWASCFSAALDAAEGRSGGGLRTLAVARSTPVIMLQYQVLATLDARLAIPELVNDADERFEGWCAAELIRIKGESIAQAGTPQAFAAAEALYQRAFDIATGQGALAWRLRIASSQYTLSKQAHVRGSAARGRLRSVYEQFTEGHGTSDLKKAENLLAKS
jgi:predicted ATPase/DNA-binding winged helix-turn-helix (wHTH) protein